MASFKILQKGRDTFFKVPAVQKNDNCFVEQKNSTHIRGTFGHLRYDTPKEIKIMNSLYRNELRLYKNFFHPVMKLIKKASVLDTSERVAGHIKRKYDTPKTPYQRLLELGILTTEKEKELKILYESLNPAQLKRAIEEKTQALFELYMDKKNSKNIYPFIKKTKIDKNYGQVLNDLTTSVSVR